MAKNLNWRKPRRQRSEQYGVTGSTPEYLIKKRKDLENRKFEIELNRIEQGNKPI